MEGAVFDVEPDGVDVNASARGHDVVRVCALAPDWGIGKGSRRAYEERARSHGCNRRLPHDQFTSFRPRKGEILLQRMRVFNRDEGHEK